MSAIRLSPQDLDRLTNEDLPDWYSGPSSLSIGSYTPFAKLPAEKATGRPRHTGGGKKRFVTLDDLEGSFLR